MLKKIFFPSALLFVTNSFARPATDSVLVDGHYRVFHFDQPAKPGSALIFALHGSGGNGMQMIRAANGFSTTAKDENVTIIAPDGYKRFWNECRKAATSPANLENINEEAFFSKMITYFTTRYQADDKKVFAIGFSGGGHMAYKLALTMPGRFRAISAVVANLPTRDNLDCGESKKPVAVMIINGTADDTNPYNGGEMKVGAITLGKVRSTEQTLQYWATVNGYTAQPAKELMPDKRPDDNVFVEKYTYSQDHKPEVVLLKVINGIHELPPGPGIDIFTDSWQFFKRQMDR